MPLPTEVDAEIIDPEAVSMVDGCIGRLQARLSRHKDKDGLKELGLIHSELLLRRMGFTETQEGKR